MKSTPRWTWGQLDYEDQLPNKNIHKNSSIHSYFRQLRHIGIEKKKKIEETPKKTEFVFHLVLLGIIKRKPEAATNDQLTKQAPNCIQTQTFHSLLFRGSVLPLAVVVPTFLCSRTLSTSELNFGGGLESTSSVEWKPRGTAPPQCESSKWKDFKKTYLYPNHTSP